MATARQPTQTAALRALQIPEILGHILHLASDWHTSMLPSPLSPITATTSPTTREATLARCGRVNRLWHHEAMRLLWALPDVPGGYPRNSLWRFFAPLAPGRRQHYAAYVEEAVLATLEEGSEEAAQADEALDGVAFPRMNLVLLFVDVGADVDWVRSGSGMRGLRVPRVQGEAVKVLQVDPAFQWMGSLDGVSASEMGTILEQVPTIFPNLEKVHFVDRAVAEPSVIKTLAERLPRLKEFDHALVSNP